MVIKNRQATKSNNGKGKITHKEAAEKIFESLSAKEGRKSGITRKGIETALDNIRNTIERHETEYELEVKMTITLKKPLNYAKSAMTKTKEHGREFAMYKR